MPEFHPGTDVEIPDAVPTSAFRNAIPNTKRYMRHNKQTIQFVCEAAYQGDVDTLDMLLASGDEKNLFNGDLNERVPNLSALHLAAQYGQTECVELLLKAKADPHMKERMPYGDDPEDGKTARDYAEENGFDDIVGILKKAESSQPYGWYVPEGPTNGQKIYGGWEHGKAPQKGWYSSRPGVAQRNGFDPTKYGGEPPKPPKIFDQEMPVAKPKVAAPKREPPLPVALLFPGQGSQYVNMMSGVKDLPAVQELVKTANSILGWDVLDMCLKGPEAKLEETRYCQVAMFVASMAALEKLKAEKPEAVKRPQAVAGLSLGEYTALCVAGVLELSDAIQLVKLRAEAMHDATKVGSQLMLSVAGLERDQLASLCKEAKQGTEVCEIVNELFPKGYSCAGMEKPIMKLKELAEAKGALQAKVLKTSGAFHTPMMEPAQKKLAAALDEALPRMQPPRTSVYMNVTGKPVPPGTAPSEIVALLKQQVVRPVLWEQSVRAMISSGITDYYEVGPMKQLKAMMKRIDQKMWATTYNIDV